MVQVAQRTSFTVMSVAFEKENELKSHMKKQHLEDNENQNNTCKCTSESVCDPCVDYWVQKGQQ